MSSDVSASCTSRSAAHKPRAADLSAARAAADAPPALPARPRATMRRGGDESRLFLGVPRRRLRRRAVAAYNAPISRPTCARWIRAEGAE